MLGCRSESGRTTDKSSEKGWSLGFRWRQFISMRKSEG